ncbi:MAG: glycosyltransferase family 2 protein [Opitutales bacterium]|nr:glycosyltransferase family 2 protein [Opitutales bacterium]
MHSIGICLPTFNSLDRLPRALDSVRQQTVTEWTLAVVHDGPSHGEELIVEAFARRASQCVTYRDLGHNRGPSAARNLAATLLRGCPLLAFLDDDDEWSPSHLETLEKRLQETSASWAFSPTRVLDGLSEREVEERRPPSRLFEGDTAACARAVFARNFIQPSAVLIRREVFDEVGGFDENLRFCEDLDLWFRLFRAGYAPTWTPVATSTYRRFPDTASSQTVKMERGRLSVYSKHAHWPTIPPRLFRRRESESRLRLGRALYRSEPATARTEARHARRLRPFHLPTLLRSLWLR